MLKIIDLTNQTISTLFSRNVGWHLHRLKIYIKKRILNKNFDITKHGDPIEISNSEFITNKINGYKNIWEFFIGNNNGYPPNVKGLTKEQSVNRFKLAENNYTVLYSLLSIQRKLNFYLVDKNQQNNPLAIFEDTKVVFSSISSVVDLLEKNMGLLNIFDQKLKDKIDLVEKYMEERNQTLHGRKLAIKIINGVVHIPKTELKANPFLSDKNWNEYEDSEFIGFYDYLDHCLTFLCELSSDIFNKIFSTLEKEWKDIQFLDVDYDNNGNEQYSGMTETNITLIK